MAGGVFFWYIDPTYKGIQELEAQNVRLDEALEKARELQAVRDELLSRYNTFAAEDISRLQKLLPDNIDNIRLVLDVDTIAAAYGLQITDFGIATEEEGAASTGQTASAPTTTSVPEEGEATADPEGVNSVLLQFSVNATYQQFLTFTRDLEKSLRLVDIVLVELNAASADTGVYSYRVTIKTYWLN